MVCALRGQGGSRTLFAGARAGRPSSKPLAALAAEARISGTQGADTHLPPWPGWGGGRPIPSTAATPLPSTGPDSKVRGRSELREGPGDVGAGGEGRGHSPKPASWEEREEGGATPPTVGLTTAGEPGPRSMRLSSVTSLSTCRQEVG